LEIRNPQNGRARPRAGAASHQSSDASESPERREKDKAHLKIHAIQTRTTATAPNLSVGRRGRLITVPAVAGIAYSTAWALGLAVWPSNLDVDATNVKVVATYSAHQGAAITQYLLVEGLAAITLGVVVTALGRAARRREAGEAGVATVVAGLTATALSLVQCALGLLLAGSVAPDGETDRAGRLFDLINRMDGVKMFALAAMAVAGVGLVRRAVLPRWLGYTAAFLTVALIASGAGYLLLNTTLAQAAFVSLALLLVWVTGAGIALARTSRSGKAAA
jgi:hypothetical protein